MPHGSYVRQYHVDADPAAARARTGPSGAGTVFGFVGAIRGYKGVDELVEAFTASARPGTGRPAAHLRQATASPDRARAGGARGDRPAHRPAAGAHPGGGPLAVLRAADVVVLPFRDILTSGSAILALSHGRPVVAPALGCLPETLPPEAAFLYDPDAPDALAGAMHRAAGADLAAMGVRARAWADGLDWGPIAAETARLYRGD